MSRFDSIAVNSVILAEEAPPQYRLVEKGQEMSGFDARSARGLWVAAAVSMFVSTAMSATIEWSNVSGGRWGDGANWIGGAVPGVNDTAVIALPVTVEIDDARTVASMSVASNSTLLIRGNGTRGNASLNLTGTGTNQGLIQIDSSSPSFTAALSVGASGVLNVAPGARIELLRTAASQRSLTGTIRNQGVIQADAGFDGSPNQIAFTGGRYIADGGVLQGAFHAVNREIQTLTSPPAASTIRIAGNACALTTDVESGYTIEVLGTPQWGNAILNVPGSLTNRGVLRFSTNSASFNSQLIAAAGQTVTNAAAASIIFAAGPRNDRAWVCGLINNGSITVEPSVVVVLTGVVTQSGGSIVANGKWQHDSGSFTFTGGSTAGSVYCSGVTVDVQGTVTSSSSLLAEGTNTLVQNASAAVTLTNEANNTAGNAVLQVNADATNRGDIRLTTTSPSFASRITIDAAATLTNAAGAKIEFLDGAGQSRFMTGNVINRGQINAEAAFDSAANRIDFSSGSYFADGGVLQGNIVLRSKTITTGASPPAASTILAGGTTNTLVGDVAAGYTIDLIGSNNFGNGVLTLAGSTTNHGVVRLGTSSPSFYAQITIAAGQTLTNAADGQLRMLSGPRQDRYLVGNLINDGVVAIESGVVAVGTGDVLQRGGTFAADGRWQQDSGALTLSGGATSGGVYASGASITVTSGVSLASAVFVEGSCAFGGNDSASTTITLEGNNTAGNAVLHAPADVSNRGTIRLTSTSQSFYSQLIGEAGAMITNELTGRIEFVSGAGQSRFLNGALRNRGLIRAEAAFDVAPGRIAFQDGDLLVDGGSIEGAVFVANRQISFISAPATPTTVKLAGANNALLTNVLSGFTVELNANSTWGHSILGLPLSVSNFGTIVLASSSPSFYSQIAPAMNQSLTNGASGVIRAAAGARPDRYISNAFRNEGVVHIDANATLTTGALVQTDSGAYEVELAGTPAGQYSRWAVSGNADLDGKLRVTRVGGFTPVIGDRFPIMTFTSFSDRFSCNDIEGIFIQDNLRFSLERNPTNLTLEVVDAALLPTDPDCNCQVDLTDLANLLVHYGTPTGMQLADGDLNGDGAVSLTDLALLLVNFGLACP